MNRYKYVDEKKEHLHTLDGTPLYGTSSVSSVLAKPLTWWASGLAVACFGVTDGKVLTKIKNKKATVEEKTEMFESLASQHDEIKGMTTEEYFKLCDQAYRAHTTVLKSKAAEGTDLHAELERFIKSEMEDQKQGIKVGADISLFNERIHPLIKWSRENVKEHLWSEGNCYSEKNWTGGISDWGIRDKAGKIAIVDFKSSKEAYLSQFWQCCGYAIQVEENGIFDKDGNQTFKLEQGQKIDYVVVVPFGMERPFPQINVDMEGGKEAFLAELLLYKKLPRD